MSTSPDFTGARLSFSLAGAGLAYDPATSSFALDAARLAEGLELTVATSGPDGAGPSFRLALSLLARTEPPRLLAPPSLVGSGVIGTAVTLDPGQWGEAEALAFAWCRDGAAIEGAAAASYTPVAEDDRRALSCRVTATNAAGSAEAETAPVLVAWPAPVLAAPLADVVLPLDGGPGRVEAAAAFAGEGLSFAVAGGEATIDPVTGVVGLPAVALGATRVTVTAHNSGGAVEAGFEVRVVPVAPALLEAPTLAGSGKVGAAVSVAPGSWSGAPSPALTLAWCRDGAPIEGATGESYTPVAADDRRALSCRVTATNAGGSAVAETAALPVTRVAPVAVGTLADLVAPLDSGMARRAAAGAFTGEGLSYAVAGAGATIDAAGVVSLPTAALLAAVPVTVTATNSGGSAQAGFTASVVAVAPALVTAPTLAGTGKIGAAVSVAAGSWSGKPAPVLALQWCRDGAEIKGATGASYTPVAADDRTALSCRVTATNAGGSAVAATAALAVTRVAPVAVGTLADVTLVQGAAAGSVAAAPAFTGGGLAFAVSGGGATVDAATGVVSLPTGTLRSGATVTVTASNSGGTASASFKLSVVAAVAPPVAVGSLPDLLLPLDRAVTTVSTQAAFAGSGLVYALEAAPAGVTILAGSGLVSIAATTALSAAKVTVRATNAAGSATQSFALTVRATSSVFDTAARLEEVGFLYDEAAPSWTLKSPQGRLVPGATGRLHGAWSLAGGDGLYRALVRWNAGDTAKAVSPFLFGGRIARSGANFSGFYVEAARISGTERALRLLQYTGAGSATTLRGSVASAWVWYTWYWFEMEVAGSAVRARLYAEADAAPAWQLEATTTHGATGAFGPAALPAGTPSLDIRRLEFVPAATAVAVPAAATANDWELGQITEEK